MNADDLHIESILSYEAIQVPDRGRPGRRCYLIEFSDGYQILSRDPEILNQIERRRAAMPSLAPAIDPAKVPA